jgi:hypothetical protein
MLVALAVLVSAAASAAPLGTALPEKDDAVHISSSVFGRQGGEDIGTAVVIPALPFNDSGTTAGYADDYDEACPYTGSTSPDVVYSYLAPDDMCISVDLCGSFYDTKVYIYENDSSTPIACNDDNFDCVNPPVLYTSWIPEAALTGGNTYYIVVDGYGGDSGDYVMDVTEVDCCEVECPPEGIDEGEGPCYDGYVDDYNGGCNSDPEAYVYVTPSTETITYCGQGGNFDANNMRDTDWYWMDLTEATTDVTICVEAEFGVILGFIDMSPGCDEIFSPYSYVLAGPCEPACLTEPLPAGPWCVFVATSDWQNWPCDSDYVLTIDGYETSAMGALDIKPESCPNPFNVKAQGQLPVAVLSTESFDATSIDAGTLSLECPDGSATPIWHMLGDVATPVGPSADPCECTEEGPDGYTDLKLKFLRQDIVAVLGEFEDGEEIELTLTGQLMDGTAFEVSDCVWILDKGREVALEDQTPVGNPAARGSSESSSWGTIKALYR